ncbi:MAG: arsenate reductase ArsC [Acidimicrobiia bacterium]
MQVTGPQLSSEQQLMIHHSAARLQEEFAGVFSAETIERFMADSLGAMAGARITAYVPLFTERFARQRLQALSKVERLLGAGRPVVLFLCTHNAGRSQMAAGWLRHLGGDRVEVYTGGSEPASEINPAAVAAMREVGIDISSEFPKPWTDEVVRAADVVVTMGCGDACPVLPGKRYQDWEVADPAGRPLEEVRPIRGEIEQRVRRLLSELEITPVG